MVSLIKKGKKRPGDYTRKLISISNPQHIHLS